MTNKVGIKYPVKRIFLIDELSVMAAYFLALLFRYGLDFDYWVELFDGLYVSFFFVICMLQVIVFLGYDRRKASIFQQDPVEVLSVVFKGKVILIILGLLYIYMNQRGEESSRFVIAAIFAFSIVIEYLAKMVYRKVFYNRNKHLYSCNTYEIWWPYRPVDEIIKEFGDCNYDEALIHTGEANDKQTDNLVSRLASNGIRTYIGLESNGYDVKSGIVSDINGYACIPVEVRSEKFDLFGIKYSIARTEEAVLHVIRHIKELSGKYICFSNVHTSVMGKESSEYREILNEAAFVFPDGSPIATLEQKAGFIGAERVAGPDFMEKMFRNTMDGSLSHYFYGSTQETLDALSNSLKAKYPGLVIKGMYSPVFGEASKEEDAADIARINAANADIVWIGLGAPKQEKWMNAHRDQIHGVMMGVGAGFNFHAGNIKRAPVWIQKIGLEWLYRLFQDPGRLFRRYFVTNIKFFWYLLLNKIYKKSEM